MKEWTVYFVDVKGNECKDYFKANSEYGAVNACLKKYPGLKKIREVMEGYDDDYGKLN